MAYEKIFDKNKPISYFIGYKEYLKQLLDKIDWDKVLEFANILIKARENGNKIYIIGNGGSLATASHFICDLAKGAKVQGKTFNIIPLDSPAIFSAYANDEGYENVFLSQVSEISKEDLLISFSASGNSKNLIKAAGFARTKGAIIISLTGFNKGGLISKIAHINISVPAEEGEYGPVEDIHLIFEHAITTFIKKLLEENNSDNHKDSI
jgi:D-sedoheptulose 7-phosphate isomerase